MTPPPNRRQAPTQDSSIPRRTLLRGGAAAGAAVALGWSLSACDTGPTQRQRDAEALIPHARAAFVQEAAARRLAPRHTEFTAALMTVADQRGAHLTALRDEINRLHSSIADQIESGPTPPTASVQALGAQIDKSASAAAETAVDSSGFAAGLLGSISASCRTLVKVQLG